MRPLAPRRSSRVHARLRTALVLAGLEILLASCGEIQAVAPTATPITDPTQLYMGLTLEDPAITLSTAAGYNTIQLNAVPRDAQGDAMPGLAAPTFHLANATDSAYLQVTSAGLVTAVSAIPLPGIVVVASLTAGRVTHTDTAHIVVTTLTEPPKLASLSIDPIPPDSTIWSYDPQGITSLLLRLTGIANHLPPTRAVDSVGNEISGLPFAYRSLDPSVTTFDRWTGAWNSGVPILNPGQVSRVVRTNAYGVALADTVTYTVTLPVGADVLVDHTFPAFGTVRVAPHALVSWHFGPTGRVAGDTLPTGDTLDITFDDPAHVAAPPPIICTFLSFFGVTLPCTDAGGNGYVIDDYDPVTFAPNDSWMSRSFPDPGTYTYHSVRRPELTGRVVVTSDPFTN